MSHCLKDNSIQFGNVINVICHGQDEPSASDPKAFALLLVPCSWAEELQNVAEEVEAAIGGLAWCFHRSEDIYKKDQYDAKIRKRDPCCFGV